MNKTTGKRSAPGSAQEELIVYRDAKLKLQIRTVLM